LGIFGQIRTVRVIINIFTNLEAQKSYETAGVEILQIGLKLAKLLQFEDLIIIR